MIARTPFIERAMRSEVNIGTVGFSTLATQHDLRRYYRANRFAVTFNEDDNCIISRCACNVVECSVIEQLFGLQNGIFNFLLMDNGCHDEGQLSDIDRFAHIDVDTRVNSHLNSFSVTQSANDDNGNSRCVYVAPNVAAQFQSMNTGQHDIKQDQSWRDLIECPHHADAISAGLHTNA